ncbi:MAG TPA: Ig-like domain-containing protein [Spirochaetota bacterium]|nr:Ig-like domain-containing protein [Spirochaetota bacterium]
MKHTRNLIVTALLTIALFGCNNTKMIEDAVGALGDSFDMQTLAVISCSPSNHEYGLPVDTVVTVEFSSDVDRASVEQNFVLTTGSTPVPGSFDWKSGNSFQYTPIDDLIVGSRYLIEIARETEDSRGNKMGAEFLSDFYVGGELEKPRVLSSTPAYTAGGTTIDPATFTPREIVINFSEPMNRSSVEAAFSINPQLTGYFSWPTDSQMVYSITSDLEYGRQYTARVTTAATDLAGNTLAGTYTLILLTGSVVTNPPPQVASITVDGVAMSTNPPPPGYNTNVSRGTLSPLSPPQIVVTFTTTTGMNKAATESAFSITPSANGTFTWNAASDVLTFIPSKQLASETIYTVRLNTGAEDVNGLNIPSDFQVRFMTNAADSLYVRVGDVLGTNDWLAIPGFLFSETPAGWPTTIVMGPANPDSRDYFFTMRFVHGTPAVGPVVMDPTSVFTNVSVIGFHPSGAFEPRIQDIRWNPAQTEVTIEVENLSNILLDAAVTGVPVLYRLTFTGGASGIKDANGNTMLENFSFDFRE